jgi:hypothetical protein
MFAKNPIVERKLLFGPYRAPPVGIGQMVRDARWGDVIVRGHGPDPMKWPLVAAPAQRRVSFWASADFVRALQFENAHAVVEAFGCCLSAVTNARKALGLRGRSPGAMRQIRATGLLANLSRRGKRRSAKQIIAMVNASSKGIVRMIQLARERAWSPEETEAARQPIAALEVARQIGRSCGAVRAKRSSLGIRARESAIVIGARP